VSSPGSAADPEVRLKQLWSNQRPAEGDAAPRRAEPFGEDRQEHFLLDFGERTAVRLFLVVDSI
jgi:hypothetical protein